MLKATPNFHRINLKQSYRINQTSKQRWLDVPQSDVYFIDDFHIKIQQFIRQKGIEARGIRPRHLLDFRTTVNYSAKRFIPIISLPHLC